MKKIEIELLPCPFCGWDADIYGTESGGFRVGCSCEDCGATLPPWLNFEKDESVMEKLQLAAKYWNARGKLP